jgi:hypothetical protein
MYGDRALDDPSRWPSEISAVKYSLSRFYTIYLPLKSKDLNTIPAQMLTNKDLWTKNHVTKRGGYAPHKTTVRAKSVHRPIFRCPSSIITESLSYAFMSFIALPHGTTAAVVVSVLCVLFLVSRGLYVKK